MAVLDPLLGLIPPGMVLFCAALSFLLPYAVYRANRAWHRYGDPPWKREGE